MEAVVSLSGVTMLLLGQMLWLLLVALLEAIAMLRLILRFQL